MTDRLIVANAVKVSGADFYRRNFGPLPNDGKTAAQRKAEADAYWAEQTRKNNELAELYRQRMADIIVGLRAKREQLTEVHPDPFRRRAA